MSTSETCPTCGYSKPTQDQLDALIGSFYNGDSYYNDYPYEWWGSRALVGSTYFVPGVGDVEVVHKEVEGAEGYETVGVQLVLRIDGQLYKKTGEHSSYNGYQWNGGLTVTQAKIREVTYYE